MDEDRVTVLFHRERRIVEAPGRVLERVVEGVRPFDPKPLFGDLRDPDSHGVYHLTFDIY
jgi:hypothetical protein